MTFLNIIKYFFYTIAFFYSIFLFYGIIVIYQILFNSKKMPIITNTDNKTAKNQGYITIESEQTLLLIGKITIISLIIIACLFIIFFAYYNYQVLDIFIQLIFSILR